MRFLILCCLFLLSCKSAVNTLESQKAEVMKVHDDAMAKMGELRNSALALEEVMEVHQDSLDIRKIIVDLEDAEEDMMMWMEAYIEPETGLEEFYNKEMIKIEKVADSINKSLEDAKKYMVK